METAGADRNLICVLFPGVVKNDDEALQCMGGIRGISQVYSGPSKKRLGLSFHPENPFAKRIFADNKKAAGVLLKLKVKRTKVDNEVKREVISTTVVGRTSKIFKFDSMCDFQYLPVHTEAAEGSQTQCLLDQIIPSGLDNINFMTEPSSSRYIVPSHFTRFDKPISYMYTDKRYLDKKDPDNSDDIHERTRSDRGVSLARYTFNLVDDLPSKPNEVYISRKNARTMVDPQLDQEYETVKKLFEERPIWSHNLIKYHTKMRSTSLKLILPCLSIYMKNGPWRMLWVRYGYDPRKDPGARMYQTLDFRLRHQAGVHSMVMRRDHMVHYKSADRVRPPRRRPRNEPYVAEDVCEGAVYFRPGMAPSQRQIFYQYCDVKLPEVEQILSEEPPPGFLCHQKRGWLPPNTDQKCRDHIFRYVKQTLLTAHNADLKFEEGGSSEEDTNSEGDSDGDDDDVDDIDVSSIAVESNT